MLTHRHLTRYPRLLACALLLAAAWHHWQPGFRERLSLAGCLHSRFPLLLGLDNQHGVTVCYVLLADALNIL